MTTATTTRPVTEGVLESFLGLHPVLILQRTLKLGPSSYLNQSFGVLFDAPCVIKGVEYSHQGFMRINEEESVSILAMVNLFPGVSPKSGNALPAVGLFIRPLNAPGAIKYASLWAKHSERSHSDYYDGGTERGLGEKTYIRIFPARAREDEGTALQPEDLLGSVEALGAEDLGSGEPADNQSF